MLKYVPSDERFNVLVLVSSFACCAVVNIELTWFTSEHNAAIRRALQGLGLLINMVEHCDHNRALLLRSPAVCPFDETSPMTWRATDPMDALEAITRVRMHSCSSRPVAAAIECFS